MESHPSPQAHRLLDCAQTLVAAGGYNSFSYADLSAEVGITKASIHHHFPRKAELVQALVRRYRAAADQGMAALAESATDPSACLQAYVGWWAACIGDGTMPICLCAMLAAELPVLPAEVADEVRLHFASLAAWLERVLSAGKASHVFRLQAGAAAEAAAFMATVHGAMLSARAQGDPALFKQIVEVALQRLVARR